MGTAKHGIYGFGPFQLDTSAYQLTHEVRVVAVPPKVIDLLALLVSRPNELVTRNDILIRLWPDVAVTDNAITQVVSELRQVLNDDPAAPAYVQTVPRRGYRFIAVVKELRSAGPAAAPAAATKDGFNTKEIGTPPLESSLTMNRSWGFDITDRSFRSAREIIGYLARAAGNDANPLFNIGPRSDSTIQAEAVERLRAVGEWLKANGESIYGTRAGPVAPHAWGVTTQRGARVYVHILDWADRTLAIPAWGARVTVATLLATGEHVDVVETDDAVILTLPLGGAAGDLDRVVVLETAAREAIR